MTAKRLFQAKSGRIRAVKMGFNWFACIFGCLWAFVNGGWILGLFMFLGNVLVMGLELLLRMAIDGVIADVGALIPYVGYMYVCGQFGNDWLARTLAGQGYRELREVASGAVEAV